MNELQVMVQQTPGVITWNFEDLKQELAVQMATYKAMVYTDDKVKDAKADVATLRKLSKAVEDRRKEIKEKCLEPYNVIEAQAKELVALIKEPIDLISKQVSDYEETQRKKRKDEILAFMADTFAGLPDDIAQKLKFKIYDNRWENATAAKKVWKEAITKARDETLEALKLLASVDEDFKDTAMAEYKKELSATAALMKAQELQKQKEIILENERKRREAEEARKAELERQRREALAREQARQVQAAQAAAQQPEPPAQAPASKPAENIQAQPQVAPRTAVWFYGTQQQLEKVMNYAKYIGAKCEVA